jgi:hypothetical protein
MGRNPRDNFILVGAGAFLFALLVFFTIHVSGQGPTLRQHFSSFEADVTGSFIRMFTPRYPANLKFQRELARMKNNGTLSEENEALIRKIAENASHQLDMPPAILWCLLFQESRLNHMAGVREGKMATGLGQFTFASFYEVNFHLDHYDHRNANMMISILGNDVRPIGAFRKDVFHPSSYYYIPTAVTATAAFLNNRYIQLKHVLDRHNIAYDPSLLWLYSAMAYNKGTRSVLSLWNERRAGGGVKKVEKSLTDATEFFSAIRADNPFEHALTAIWPDSEAEAYARELKIHMGRLSECAISNDTSFLPGITRKEEK